MPNAAGKPLELASSCFPGFIYRAGEAKNGPEGPF
jgi:hypothetical protein